MMFMKYNIRTSCQLALLEGIKKLDENSYATYANTGRGYSDINYDIFLMQLSELCNKFKNKLDIDGHIFILDRANNTKRNYYDYREINFIGVSLYRVGRSVENPELSYEFYDTIEVSLDSRRNHYNIDDDRFIININIRTGYFEGGDNVYPEDFESLYSSNVDIPITAVDDRSIRHLMSEHGLNDIDNLLPIILSDNDKAQKKIINTCKGLFNTHYSARTRLKIPFVDKVPDVKSSPDNTADDGSRLGRVLGKSDNSHENSRQSNTQKSSNSRGSVSKEKSNSVRQQTPVRNNRSSKQKEEPKKQGFFSRLFKGRKEQERETERKDERGFTIL